MSEDLTLDDIKNAIEEMGHYVSEIRLKGPCWVVFVKRFCEKTNKLIFGKYAVESGTRKIKNIDDLKSIITENEVFWKQDDIKPIFSLYTLEKIHNYLSGESWYALRYTILDNFLKGSTEITIEEAKEILKTRRDDVSMEFYQDLKAIYDL